MNYILCIDCIIILVTTYISIIHIYFIIIIMYNVYLTKMILIISLKLYIIVQEKRINNTFKFIIYK